MKFCHDGCQRRPDTRAALGVAKEEFLLIYYGYIYPGKGMETLIAAMHLLKQRAVPVRLLVVGGYGDHVGSADDQAQRQAYGQQIEELPERLGIAHEVIWTGPCPSDDERASALLYAADACVLPFDGGVHLNNSSFAAAAAHGLPIVTTRSATTEPAFRDGETAILCSPKDPGALAAAIQALVRQPALQRRMRHGARAMAAQWFCWEAAAQRTIETFA
jgi:glycosyltransferase involved in cell wall biosynthesis